MRHRCGWRNFLATIVSGGAFLLAFCALSQAQVPSIPPGELVRRTVQNETRSGLSPTKYLFRNRKKTPRGSQTRLMVETTDAMAGLVIANDGKPLTTEEREAESARLKNLIDNPSELQKKRQREKDNEERTTRIVKALPDAFVYQYGEATAGTPGIGKQGDPLVRVNFTPKPDYVPPSHVEQVLTGMQGYLLIDSKQQHIAKIDGTLMKDVGFGWGILGHLDRGGRFVVELGEMSRGDWEVTHMTLSFTGRVLIFKSLNIQSEEAFSNFRQVPPNLNFAQGVEVLKKEAATEMARKE